jgi:hypothetical protein
MAARVVASTSLLAASSASARAEPTRNTHTAMDNARFTPQG